MISQVLRNFPWPWITCIGLMIFFGFFVSMLVWVFRKGSAGFYEELAAVPIRDAARGSETGRAS